MNFVATSPPVYAADGYPECLVHSSWMTHPVVGAGRGFRPRSPQLRSQLSRLEAFIDLQWHPHFVARILPGLHGNVMTLDLRADSRVDYDASAQWNAKSSDVRSFVVDLERCGLITEALGHGLIDALPCRSGSRDQLPRKTRVAVLAKTSGKCVYCGVSLTTLKGRPNSYHADHVLAVAIGGSDDVANLVPSCAKCNSRKGTKTMLEFLREGSSDGD